MIFVQTEELEPTLDLITDTILEFTCFHFVSGGNVIQIFAYIKT